MRINDIDLKQLRYFVAVAEELHFSRAAQRLGLSQPPLSQHIKALEQHLGVQLFARSKRHVALTMAGQAFLTEARQVLVLMAQAGDRAQRIARGTSGLLRLGLNYSAPLHPVTQKLLAGFRRQQPNIEFEIILHDSHDERELLDLARNRLDAAFVWLRPQATAPGLRRISVAQDKILVALPQGHKLAAHAKLSAAQLAREKFIGKPDWDCSGLPELTKSFFKDTLYPPKLSASAHVLPFMLIMVAVGQGLALVPEFLAKDSLAKKNNNNNVVFRPLVGAAKLRFDFSCLINHAQDNPARVLFENYLKANAA